VLGQATSASTEDSKAAAAGAPPKINEFRNKFEKFGSPMSKMAAARKPAPGAPGAAAGAGAWAGAVSGSEAVDRACREARELADQLQQQVTAAEQSRIADRQQLVDKLETRDAEMRAVSDKNAAVSSSSSSS